jgi:hypothetical protein
MQALRDAARRPLQPGHAAEGRALLGEHAHRLQTTRQMTVQQAFALRQRRLPRGLITNASRPARPPSWPWSKTNCAGSSRSSDGSASIGCGRRVASACAYTVTMGS